jgi:hypothetical protein
VPPSIKTFGAPDKDKAGQQTSSGKLTPKQQEEAVKELEKLKLPKK